MSHVVSRLINFTRPDRHGFALAEVMIATVILSVGIVASLTAMRSGMQLQNTASTRQQAIYLAEEKLALVGSETPLEPGDYHGREEGSREAFTWQVKIIQAEVEEAGELLFLAGVTVTYPSRPRERTVSLSRYFLADLAEPDVAEPDLGEQEELISLEEEAEEEVEVDEEASDTDEVDEETDQTEQDSSNESEQELEDEQ